MTTVYIALGTNLGDRERNLERALERLGTRVHITCRSTVYETEPWGVTDQPRFLNMVVEADTELEAEGLLAFIKDVERELGRTPGPRYGPRVLDLDILLYGSERMATEDLVVPHPRLAERRFVLVPLTELAPDLMVPGLGASARELLSRLPDDESVRTYKSPAGP